MGDVLPFRRKRRKWTRVGDYAPAGAGRAPRFDAAWNSRRKREARWRWLRWWLTAVLAMALLAVAYLWPAPDDTAQWTPVTDGFASCDTGNDPCVIDGDTVAIGQRRVRLKGFDTPEMDGACANERMMAEAAKTALITWLAEGPFEWDGGADPPHDKYGRELRAARRGDERLAVRMVKSGLAAESARSVDAIDWCAMVD